MPASAGTPCTHGQAAGQGGARRDHLAPAIGEAVQPRRACTVTKEFGKRRRRRVPRERRCTSLFPVRSCLGARQHRSTGKEGGLGRPRASLRSSFRLPGCISLKQPFDRCRCQLAHGNNLPQAVRIERSSVPPGAVAVLEGPFDGHGVERSRLALHDVFTSPDACRTIIRPNDSYGPSLRVRRSGRRILRGGFLCRACRAGDVRLGLLRGHTKQGVWDTKPTGPHGASQTAAHGPGGCLRSSVAREHGV